MTPVTSKISTTPEIAVGTHFHARYGTETILSFSLTDGEASWLLLLSITPYYRATRKHVFLYPQEDRSGLRKPEKGQASILITSTTSIHLPNLVSIDLTIKSDLVLTNPIGKDGVRGWSM